MNLKEYLESIELIQYIESFEKNDVTFDVLKTLSDDDLKELGIESFGHRKTILNNLKSSTQANASNENPLFDKEKWSKQTIVSGLSIGTLLLPWISITSTASISGFGSQSYGMNMFGIATWIGDVGLLISIFMIYASLQKKDLFRISSTFSAVYSLIAIVYLVPELGMSSSFSASAGGYSASASFKGETVPSFGLYLYFLCSVFALFIDINQSSEENEESNKNAKALLYSLIIFSFFLILASFPI